MKGMHVRECVIVPSQAGGANLTEVLKSIEEAVDFVCPQVTRQCTSGIMSSATASVSLRALM